MSSDFSERPCFIKVECDQGRQLTSTSCFLMQMHVCICTPPHKYELTLKRTHMYTYAHVHIQYSIFTVGKQKEMSKFLTFTRVSLPNSLPSHTLTTPSEIILNSEGMRMVLSSVRWQKKIKARKFERNELLAHDIFKFIYTFIHTLLCPWIMPYMCTS